MYLLSSTPLKLAYNIFEPKDGSIQNLSPIIFLHAAFSSKEFWDDIPEIVANRTRRKVYVLDARNHGDSEWSSDFSFEKCAEDLSDFVDFLGVKKAILIGHSMGGLASLILAYTKPEKVEYLIIEDAPPRPPFPHEKSAILSFAKFCIQTAPLVPPTYNEVEAEAFIVDFINKKTLVMNNSESRKKLSRLLVPLKRGIDGRYFVKFKSKPILQYIMSNRPLNYKFSLYQGPVTFIFGGKSIYDFASEFSNVNKEYPLAEVVVLKEATHFVHSEFPKEFADIVTHRILKQQDVVLQNKI